MILYFSGTGNSKYAADVIAELTGDEIVSLGDVIKNGERAVFKTQKPFVVVCPIYAWRFPRKIEELLKKSEFSGSKRIYFVATMGQNSGNCEKYCKKLAEDKGMEFMGFSGIVMPDNFVVGFKMPSEEEARETIERALPEMRRLGERIRDCKRIEKTDKTLLPGLMSGAVNRGFNLFNVGKKKFVVSDKCVSCGICESCCAVNNIKLVDGKPVFGNNCIWCCGCINRCPQAAIDIKGKTEKHGRYVCPEYSSADR